MQWPCRQLGARAFPEWSPRVACAAQPSAVPADHHLTIQHPCMGKRPPRVITYDPSRLLNHQHGPLPAQVALAHRAAAPPPPPAPTPQPLPSPPPASLSFLAHTFWRLSMVRLVRLRRVSGANAVLQCSSKKRIVSSRIRRGASTNMS